MSEEKTLTMWDLEKDMRAEIRDRKDELLESKYPEDLITEMVDSSVPVYHHDLLDVAASDNSLALDEPEVLAFDGKPTPINAIAGNIYQKLYEIAIEEWEEIKEEIEEEKDTTKQ